MGIFSKDIGIDLGTASVLVYIKGKGGRPAGALRGGHRQEHRQAAEGGHRGPGHAGPHPGQHCGHAPLREGVISDYDMTERMLKEFIKKVTTFSLFKPRLLVCVPSGITEVEERAVVDAGIQAGARRAYLIEEPVAAAIGAGIDITKPDGHMVVGHRRRHRRHRRDLPGRRGGVRLHQDRRRQVRRGGGQVYPPQAQRPHRPPARDEVSGGSKSACVFPPARGASPWRLKAATA